MSLRADMLRAAGRASRVLGEAAAEVAAFFQSQFNPDGGWRDRGGQSDLYYTVFGMEGALALGKQIDIERILSFLARHTDARELDLVQCSCVARCWADLTHVDPALGVAPAAAEAIRRRMGDFACADGGFSTLAGALASTLYGTLLAVGVWDDLDVPLPDHGALVRAVDSLRSDDGAFANQRGMAVGLTTSTAAAASVLVRLGERGEPALGRWLLERQSPRGGFFAAPAAPIPDLLSTATALHALTLLGTDLDPLRERTLDFIDTLWNSRGGFHGNWADDALDCEYTYYALLALGHLA